MAEAAAELGIAAAAVQFFDFSLKALSLCKEIRDSEKGASQANQELEKCLGQLKQLYEDLRVHTRLQVTDRPVTKARQDCMAVVDELLKLLNDVRFKSRDNNFAAVRAAFRVLKNKRSIEVLQNKLSQAQTRFMSALSVETKNDVVLLLEKEDKLSDTIQKSVLPELRRGFGESAASHKSTQDQVVTVAAASSASHGKTHDLLQDIQSSQRSSLRVARSTEMALWKGLTTIRAKTNVMNANAGTASRRKDVMTALWHPEMFDRQQSIKPPLFKSFEWIFDDSPASETKTKAPWEPPEPQERPREGMRGKFARWLRSEELFFWISGKTGSGKSSLMSLIQSDRRTDEALSVWAGGRHVYKFSFYFWRPGSALQKTVRGLIRSLLFQLAQANDVVLDNLTATQSTVYDDWTTASLLAAFRKALSAFRDDRIFLLLDGLDEYEDDYDDLLELIFECQQEACLKICVASRPETQILNKLSIFPFLRLQDLNYKDIELYVEGRLRPYEDRIPRRIREGLVQRAEGVFLWAVLISEDVKRGAAAGDDFKVLQRRLDSRPTKLNQLFEQLLEEIDDEHLETLKLCFFHLDKEFWLCSRNEKHCLLTWITASMPQYRHIRTSEEFIASCIKNSENLIAQGKGLLEFGHYYHGYTLSETSAWIFNARNNQFIPVDSDTMKFCQRPIKFVHRSAHDFIFGLEETEDEQDRWRLTEKDIHKLFHWTLRGCEMLLRYLPLQIHDIRKFEHWHPPCSFDCNSHLNIECITGLVVDTKRRDEYIAEWLDRIYEMLPERFATQREVPLLSEACRAWSSKVDLSTTWRVERTFWVLAAKFDGYLISRWNRLAQHPHAHAICTSIIFDTREIPNEYQNLLIEAKSKMTTTVIAHIHGWSEDQKWSISWDADGAMDEQYVMAIMATELSCRERRLKTLAWDFIQARSQRVFMGLFDIRFHIPLHIQVPIHTARRWQFFSSSSASSGEEGMHLRLLCVAPYDHRKAPTVYETCWDEYGDLVDGVCDIHVELRGAAVVQIIDGHSRFYCFTGTKDQFYTCLEQVKNEIRANKDKQLSHSQQSHMLEIVEEFLICFWTIGTPRTLAPAAIIVNDDIDDDDWENENRWTDEDGTYDQLRQYLGMNG